MKNLPTINALWIGTELGPLHSACLRSFVRHGHRTVLHVYDEPTDVPHGVELADGSRLMKRKEIVAHKKTGSLALASDIFRYRILAEGLGVYVDCDVFCLKPFPNADFLMGWQDEELICSAVLAAPAKSEFVKSLVEASSNPTYIPPWLKAKKRRILRLRKILGVPRRVVDMPWGTIGPMLVTHTVKSFGLEHDTQPIDVFYPLAYGQRPLLRRTGLKLSELVTSNSLAIHLWNSGLFDQTAPRGTPLEEIHSV
jgi:hypothetical protein